MVGGHSEPLLKYTSATYQRRNGYEALHGLDEVSEGGVQEVEELVVPLDLLEQHHLQRVGVRARVHGGPHLPLRVRGGHLLYRGEWGILFKGKGGRKGMGACQVRVQAHAARDHTGGQLGEQFGAGGQPKTLSNTAKSHE